MQELATYSRQQRAVARGASDPVIAKQMPSPCVAKVAGVDAKNRILVEIPGVAGSSPARLIKGVRREDLLSADGTALEALVVFDGGRSDRPIIIGLLQGEDEKESTTEVVFKSSGKSAVPEKVLVEALAELVLKCGAGSLTLRKDGKIVLRGTHLLSRSSGPIRIKGGHVEIN